MKRVLTVATLLAALTACGATEPKSVPIPTIETSDTTTTDTTPPTTTTTTPPPTTTTPLPATEVPEVAPPPPVQPPPVQPPPYTPPPAQPPPAAPADVYYANCTEARAAGAAPLYRGEPGYRSGLDRDDDGVACET